MTLQPQTRWQLGEARRRWKVAWAAWRVQHAPELLTNVDRAYLRQAGAGPGPVA